MTTNSLATNTKQETIPQTLKLYDPINWVYQRKQNLQTKPNLNLKNKPLIPQTSILFMAFFLCYLSLTSMNVMIYASPRQEPLTITPKDIKPLSTYFPQWPRQEQDKTLETSLIIEFDPKALARSQSLSLIETITKPLSYGFVNITARPWGRAHIKNGKTGATPTTFRVPTGKQTIIVTYPPNKKSVHKSIFVSKNKLTRCKAAFNQKSGHMICK